MFHINNIVLPLHVPFAHFPSPFPTKIRQKFSETLGFIYFLIISFSLHFVNEGVHISLETKFAFLGDGVSTPFEACFIGPVLRFVSPPKLRAEIITLKQEEIFYVFVLSTSLFYVLSFPFSRFLFHFLFCHVQRRNVITLLQDTLKLRDSFRGPKWNIIITVKPLYCSRSTMRSGVNLLLKLLSCVKA